MRFCFRESSQVTNIYCIEYTSSDRFIPCIVTISLLTSIKGHMLIQQYQNITEELYCDPKEEVIMDCFPKSVTSNDSNDNPPQPEKTKVSQKNNEHSEILSNMLIKIITA